MTQSPGTWVAIACAVALAGCGRPADPGAVVPLSEAERAGYLPGPVVIAVVAAPDGAPLVRGRARPSGRIRATLPSGEAYGATADSRGRFELALPAGPGAVLTAISAEDGGRSTPTEGWLFAPSGDFGHAVMLRAGTTSRALASRAPLIAVVDFDAAGGAGVSGRSPGPGEVRLFVDGAPAGSTQSDSEGRYSLRLAPPAPGAHRLRAVAGDIAEERILDFTAPPAPPTGPFSATRTTGAWRVDWSTPGGGLQSTYILTGAAS